MWMGGFAAASTIAVIAIVMYLIHGISNGANALDDTKTRQAINAMLAGLESQLSGTMIDKAKWDDAVAHTYGPVDMEWLYDTWGTATSEPNYDAVFILDEAGATLAGFSDGDATTTSADAMIGPGLKRLIASLPNDQKTYATAVEIQQTSKGFSVVAVAPIMPFTEKDTIPSERPRLLTLVKTLTPTFVSEIGSRLIIKDLKITPALAGEKSFVTINQKNGAPAGFISWSADRPGDVARAAIQGPAAAILGCILACMGFFVFKTQRMSLALERSEQQAWTVAHADPLTNLPNRLAAKQILEHSIATRKAGTTSGLAVMLADLDGFKDVNDTYGHHVGDDLIRGIAAGLQLIATRFDATVSRLGGDEFAIIVAGDDVGLRTNDFSKAAIEFLIEPLNLGGRIARVGISIGVAKAESTTIDSTELMRRADVAMYYAKENGKNRSVIYEPRFDTERNSRVDMAKLLAEALDNEQIEVAYQPIVDAQSHVIKGVESLARWQQQGGMHVPPDEFIKVAEEFGLIDRLGNQVLSKACRQAASWPNIDLSVNISPAQFRNPDFVANILAIVDASGLARHRLELEVTESYLIEQSDRAKPIIEKLRAQGIKMALDDFGTGYSSIGYLREYQFDRIKVDKSLIRGMMTDKAAQSIIQATTVLAQSMNLSVTAEGIETEDEANILRMVGCQDLQGYYFGTPQPAASITALLTSEGKTRAVA